MNKILFSSHIDSVEVSKNPHINDIAKSLYSFNFSHGQNFEKLQGMPNASIYSVRLNQKSRAIFSPIHIDNQLYWVLLKLLPNHEYHRLQPYSLRQLLENDKAYLLSQINAAVEINFENIPDENYMADELNFFKNQYLVFDESQHEATIKALPILISGAPGSGKTCVATEILCQKQEEKVLYVAQSPNLVNEIQHQFQDNPLFNTETTQTHFSNYSDLVMPYYQHQNIANKTHFTEWCKGRHLNDVDIYYQEFRIFSGYIQNIEDYFKLGVRQSYFVDRAHIPNLFNDYLNYLHSKKLIDVSFSPLSKPMSLLSFDIIVIDEAQELSGLQLNILKSLAPHHQVVVLMDTNQSSQDNISKMHFLKTIFEIKAESCIQLKTCYRSSQAVIRVANKLLEIKNACLGGVSEKGQLHQIEMLSSSFPGEGLWCDDKEETINLLSERFNNDARCIVIAHESEHEQARKFGVATILTPAQALGLEYHYVIAYKLFAQPQHEEINRFLKNYNAEKINHNRSKNKMLSSFDTTLLNADLIAVSRAKDGIFIVEINQCHPNPHLIKKVRESLMDLTQANHQELLVKKHESSSEEWEKLSEQLQNSGLQTIANAVSSQYLQAPKAIVNELSIEVKGHPKSKKKSKTNSPVAPAVQLSPIDEFIQLLIKKIKTREQLINEVDIFTDAKERKSSIFYKLSYQDLLKKFDFIVDGIVYQRSLIYFLVLSLKPKPFQKHIENIIKQLTVDDLFFNYRSICYQDFNYDQHIDLVHMMLRNIHIDLLEKLFKKPEFREQITKSYLLSDTWYLDENQYCKKLLYFLFCGDTLQILKKIFVINQELIDFEVLTSTLFYTKNDNDTLESHISKSPAKFTSHNVNMFSLLLRSVDAIGFLETVFQKKPYLLHQMTLDILLKGNDIELTKERGNLLLELSIIDMELPWLQTMYEHCESLREHLQISDFFTKTRVVRNVSNSDYLGIGHLTNTCISAFGHLFINDKFNFIKLVFCSKLETDPLNGICLYDKLNEDRYEEKMSSYNSYLDILCSSDKGRDLLLTFCQYPSFCQQFTKEKLNEETTIYDARQVSLLNYLKRSSNGQKILEAIALHNPTVQSQLTENKNLDDISELSHIEQIFFKYNQALYKSQIIPGGNDGEEFAVQGWRVFQKEVSAIIKAGLTTDETTTLLTHAFYFKTKAFMFILTLCNNFDAFTKVLIDVQPEISLLKNRETERARRQFEFFSRNQLGDLRSLPTYPEYKNYCSLHAKMLQKSPSPDGNIIRQVIAEDSLSDVNQVPVSNILNNSHQQNNNYFFGRSEDRPNLINSNQYKK